MDKTTSVTLSDTDRANIEAIKALDTNPRITDMRAAISYALQFTAMFSSAPRAAVANPSGKRGGRPRKPTQTRR